MSKFFSRLLMPGALLFALPLGFLPVSAKAELTDHQLTDAFFQALRQFASYSSGVDWAFAVDPYDVFWSDAEGLGQFIRYGLFNGGDVIPNQSWGSLLYQNLYAMRLTNEVLYSKLDSLVLTNDTGQVQTALDVITNQLASINLYSSAISLKTDWISEDVTYINHSFQDLYLEFLATLHRTDFLTDGQNVWVMNPEDIGEEVGSAVGSTLGSELSLATSKLDEIISRLTPTNHVDISAEEVNYLDQDDFGDTSDVLSEEPYDDTSYSSPTNTDHFAGIGNPTLLDLPDPTTKLNSLASSVESLDQDSEIVFWNADSGTPADALGKVSIKLGEQAPVQWSGTFFQAGWNLLYAIFSGLAVWRFVINVHPEAGQMQGKLF